MAKEEVDRHGNSEPDPPSLVSNVGAPNNIPVQLTSFIGRQIECAAVEGVLAANRLVTLVGSGGCGKTRLSMQVAANVLANFPDGVWWVDLAAPLLGEELVAQALANTLGLKEVPTQPLPDTLTAHLHGMRALVVLDNCEHVVAACAELVDRLLRSSPSLSILATSREALGVDGEVRWSVPSLGLPPADSLTSPASLLASEAPQLFVERARRVRPSFQISDETAQPVAEICRRLDGIPLALELAAACIRLMSPGQIADELDDRFRLLTGSARSAPPRQQTLRASVDWSHDLLEAEQRIVLRRLAVFAGGFNLDAAQAVCSSEGISPSRVLDLCSQLVDRSLVQVEEGRTTNRYRLLETIQEYALERLVGANEEEAVRSRHLAFFMALAERARPEIERAKLIEWMTVFDLELDNLRAALDWSLKEPTNGAFLRMTSALWPFWLVRGHLTEGIRRIETALSLGTEPRVRGDLLIGAAELMSYRGDLVATHKYGEEALRIAQSAGDERLLGRALDMLGYAAVFLDPSSAPGLFDESLRLLRSANDGFFLADALNGLGMAAIIRGDLPAAVAALEEGVACSRDTGNAHTMSIGLVALGYSLALQGRLEQARDRLEEGLAITRQLRDRVFASAALYSLGFVEAHRGDHRAADMLLVESIELARDASSLMLSFALVIDGLAHYIRADFEGARSRLREALELAGVMQLPWATSFSQAILGNIWRVYGDLEEAQTHIGEALAVAKTSGLRLDVAIDAEARLTRAAGDLEHAESLHHDALEAAHDAESVLTVPAQLEALASLAAAGESFAEAARLFGAAESARVAFHIERYVVDRESYEADLALLRGAMTEDELRAAWIEGQSMSPGQAIAYSSRGRGKRRRPSFGWASLTPTECDVVGHVAKGLSNPQIAARLFISRSTVKAHLAHIFTKLGIASRSELAAEAIRRELGQSH